MKTIKSYKELELSSEAKSIIYEISHAQRYKNEICRLLPEGRSVWIDSAGDSTKPNIIVFEHKKWKEIFDPRLPIKYYDNFSSPTLVQIINKYICPASVVIYESDELKYLTPQELITKLDFLHRSYSAKLIVYINLLHIDFNKLKYTPIHVLNLIKGQMPSSTIIHTINRFRYILEMNT
jgi:hypothetical protein